MSQDLSEISEALRPIAADYWATVRTIAAEALAEHPYSTDEAEEYAADEARREFVTESVDGNYWVIYTYAAQAVALISDNDGAWEEFGTDGIVKDGSLNWSLLAYCAMEADVFEPLAVYR